MDYRLALNTSERKTESIAQNQQLIAQSSITPPTTKQTIVVRLFLLHTKTIQSLL